MGSFHHYFCFRDMRGSHELRLAIFGLFDGAPAGLQSSEIWSMDIEYSTGFPIIPAQSEIALMLL